MVYSITEKYKYLEALSIVNDDFYSDKIKEKYKEFIKNYLKHKNK